MPESILKVLQFGAMGLLAVVLVFGLLALQKIATRMIVAFDKISDAVTAGQREAIQRHHESTERMRAIVAEYAAGLRSEIRDSIDGDEIKRHVDEAAKELRHHFNNVADKVIAAQADQSETTRDHISSALRPIEYRVLGRTHSPMPFAAPRPPKESDR